MESKAHLTADIDKFTRIANEEFKKGNFEEAIKFFDLALNNAFQYGDAFTERASAFNLGGAYVASGNPEKGLEYLQKAVPPMDKRDGASNGDLYYNFALAYEKLEDEAQMVKYLDKALQEYLLERTNSTMIAHIGNRLGNIYANDGQYLLAADNFGSTANAFGALNCPSEKVKALNQQAFYLLKGGSFDNCVNVLNESLIFCRSLQDLEQKGKFLNDIGLSYTQCKEFQNACECFLEALPLCRGNKPDKKREAAICQNLGAIYNSLGDYEQAIKYHEEAGTLHAQLGNRKCQGQCFINMAYAYSMLKNKESANEYYLHGQQAAKDSGDSKSHWQALEGLGSLAANAGNLDKAIKYYKLALNVMCKGVQEEKTHDRILSKLTDAIQKKVMADIEHGSYYDSEVSSRGSRRGVVSDYDQPLKNRSRIAEDRKAAHPAVISNPPLSRNDLNRSGQKGVHVSNAMPTMFPERTRENPLQFAATTQDTRSNTVSREPPKHLKPSEPDNKVQDPVKKGGPLPQKPVLGVSAAYESSSAYTSTESSTSETESEIEAPRKVSPEQPRAPMQPRPQSRSNDTSRTEDTVPVLSPSESDSESSSTSDSDSSDEERAQVRAEMAKFHGDSSLNRTISNEPVKIEETKNTPGNTAPKRETYRRTAPQCRSSAREASESETSESETEEEDDETPRRSLRTGTYINPIPAPRKEEPLYHEIEKPSGPENGGNVRFTDTGKSENPYESLKFNRTAEGTNDKPGPSNRDLTMSDLPRAEREKRLFEHQQKYNQQKKGKDQTDGDQPTKSKACIVM